MVIASGQAVVFYRLAIMSKDGDWVIRETPQACEHVLDELTRRGATYRPGAPLDVRWLAGGWSSHFEFTDEQGRRVRCDFFSRPPRVDPSAIDRWFAPSGASTGLVAVDLDSLVRMKRTQRAKDYPVIGALATRLPPERELEVTVDVDRLMQLVHVTGDASSRPAVVAARHGDRRAAVLALAEEVDAWQREDRRRLERYEHASRQYLSEFRAASLATSPLPEAHARVCDLAQLWLPITVEER